MQKTDFKAFDELTNVHVLFSAQILNRRPSYLRRMANVTSPSEFRFNCFNQGQAPFLLKIQDSDAVFDEPLETHALVSFHVLKLIFFALISY